MYKVILPLIIITLFNVNIILAQYNNSIEGKKWILKQLTKGEVEPNDKLKNEPYLIFGKENKLSGNGSCNNIMGSYEITGNFKIKFNAATTRMMCENMKTETPFIQALQKANNFLIKDNILMLQSGKMLLAKFESVPLETTLENTQWNLTELVGKPTGKSSMNDSYYTLIFNNEGKVNGKVCNTLIGDYTKGGNNELKVEMKVSTMMSCPELETEMLFKEALSFVSGYEIVDNKELVLKNGRIILARFTANEN